MTKVMITIRDGAIGYVSSTEDIQFIVIDYDNLASGGEVWSDDFRAQDYLQTEEEMDTFILKENERYLQINNDEED